MDQRSSVKFQLLRCLLFCIGITASSSHLLAQAATFGTGGSAQPGRAPDPKSRALTFEYLDADAGDTVQVAASEPEDAWKNAKKSKKSKQSKRSKQAKKCKQCGDIFFQGLFSVERTITVEFESTSSEILIEIFDDEDAYIAGVDALQTITYETACYDSIPDEVQLGTVVITGQQGLDNIRDLTFEYQDPDDDNYRDIVLNQPGTQASVLGSPDDDDLAYVVVYDAKGGKRCKKFKRYKKYQKSADIFFESDTTTKVAQIVSAANAETLLQVFEDEEG